MSTYIAYKRPSIRDEIAILISELNATLPGMTASGDKRPATPYCPEKIIGLKFKWLFFHDAIYTGFDDVDVR
jgi:hypothetical protein